MEKKLSEKIGDLSNTEEQVLLPTIEYLKAQTVNVVSLVRALKAVTVTGIPKSIVFCWELGG